ncbi:MAG TPA: phosphatase PAP2 family protein [Solirubrobacteraceae bacterium]|jgi:PAP2 superfamily|nr:phosphatase PAP2 family protein [Solirubrobacteraceae bacterium]
MAATAHTTTPFVYVESDIPEGVTLAEWRRGRRPGEPRRVPVLAALGRVARRPVIREIALAVLAYLIYEGARLLTAGSYPSAFENAQRVVALERHLNLDVEGTVQRTFLDSPLLTVLNYVYLLAQNLILPASLVFLYRVNRATYRTLRNTLLATWLLSIPVYALFPAAPPRLAGLGIVDTVSSGSPLQMESGTTTSLINQFAAVPSLHVGFAFAIGIAVAAALRAPLLRVAALLWGPLVLLSVVATGNHFIFDALAGLTITTVGYGVGRAVAGGWPARSSAAVYALGARCSSEPAPAMA